MNNFRTYINNHKKLFSILVFIFIICLECCVFPVGNFALGVGVTIGIINFAAAIGIGKCIGEIEAFVFPKASLIFILFLNFGITMLGMIARYFLEYGEVSNTYNFTFKNIVVHMVIMLMLSTAFWMYTRRRQE